MFYLYRITESITLFTLYSINNKQRGQDGKFSHAFVIKVRESKGYVVSIGEGERRGRGVIAREGTWCVRVWSNCRIPSIRISLQNLFISGSQI